MESFNQIISGEMPVLVDFHAEWCGPCKAMNPVISQLGKAVQGKARVLKVDIDKNQQLANELRIQAVPTFMIFKEGKAVWRHSGMIDGKSLQHQLMQLA